MYYRLCLTLLLSFVALTAAVNKVKAFTNSASNIKILQADILKYKNKRAILDGNVKISLDNFLISSDHAEYITGKYAKFTGTVIVSSPEMIIEATELYYDLKLEDIKLYNAKTVLESAEQTYLITAEEQRLDFKNHKVYATNPISKEKITVIEVNKKDLTIEAYELIADLDAKNSKVEMITFLDDVELLKDGLDLTAQKIFYYPALKQAKAYEQVVAKILKNDKDYLLKADFLMYENDEVITAMSNSKDRQIYNQSLDLKYFGTANLLRSWLKDGQVILTVYSGNVDLQLNDKKMVGDELILEPLTKNVRSVLGRPKAIWLKGPEAKELKQGKG
jgi:lipopolysaccharide export system protein LptA